jgi:putative transposase
MADLYRNKYRIPSARAPWWDYGRNAAYFVTICTKDKEHYFGEVKNGEMRLSEIGQIAHDRWQAICDHFPFVRLQEWVVMPNHVHGIIVIDRYGVDSPPVETLHATSPNANAVTPVETLHATSLPTSPSPSPSSSQPSSTTETLHATSLPSEQGDSKPPTPPKNEAMAAISPKPGSLSTIIRSYKSAVSKQARTIHADFAWQSRFHDHVIRDAENHTKIQHYILNNPLLWDRDKFNPNNQDLR